MSEESHANRLALRVGKNLAIKLAVSVPRWTIDALQDTAEAEGTSISRVVKDALVKYAKAHANVRIIITPIDGDVC